MHCFWLGCGPGRWCRWQKYNRGIRMVWEAHLGISCLSRPSLHRLYPAMSVAAPIKKTDRVGDGEAEMYLASADDDNHDAPLQPVATSRRQPHFVVA
jgi:hypothetical protein